MRYAVFSLNQSRPEYAPLLRGLDGLSDWHHQPVDVVDGSKLESLSDAIDSHGYQINWKAGSPPLVGQLGIWYTVLNALEYAPLVTFEDDAILGQNFQLNWEMRKKWIPEDMDFFSLFLPRDSDHMWDRRGTGLVTRTYQRYGGVSMYYSKQGADKIKALLERDGITGQYDDTLYAYSALGELNGYCSRPDLSDLVYISGLGESIVQESQPWN